MLLPHVRIRSKGLSNRSWYPYIYIYIYVGIYRYSKKNSKTLKTNTYGSIVEATELSKKMVPLQLSCSDNVHSILKSIKKNAYQKQATPGAAPQGRKPHLL